MGNAELNELKQKYVAAGAASPATAFADRAENAEIWDADGNRFIDFAGGIGVLNVGHRHPKVVAAVKAQLDKVMHTCQTVMPYEGYVKVAEKLSHIVPVRGHAKVMLANSGAEALENAVKIARAATGRSNVICFDGGYHGRTFYTMAMNGKVAPYQTDFGPMPGTVFRAPYPVPYHGVSEDEAIRGLKMTLKTDANPKDTAAIILEPVLGEGGFYPAPTSFLKKIREICDEHGMLMIIDEVQSGFGRTGKMFAIEHSGVEPDMMTMAKSMADGMPISAIVGTDKVMDASGPNSLGGTYTGSPTACAAALAVMEVFEEENILEKSQTLGETLAARFNEWQGKFDCIDHVRNMGAMAAFELVNNKTDRTPNPELAAALCKKAREEGLILLSCGMYGNTIRFLMPVTIEDDVLNEGLDIIESCLESLI
ncbi:4-aminobutyrate transaminase [Vreelandella aquamarina]|jgi:4-aminobutyrate aminotransferase/(S)-3-amino-2-methylpropionate transaminase|uniref:4-aminobutyrate aminotransferase / (S)-3-amino-2-methylpropionate transaminase n=1 Tax=Vreelandella aquamarina TaxID=77097 RepID=A0A1N6IB79_9GAMM|nr:MULTISPECIES: 4-aminobutyrate--2-oxoglutarate transaminase [Halomonas]MEC9304805.1 4-aminobutyrate--2-oxoglutarate transaminase [Pseudomonadota bacterium]MCC4292261.1 4-aminobutyrate--2-oxoglutarate transaminase [Halomonas axialensis]MDC8444063.1 4-aminobutyrate--2-oxoglutarate transaminase [Halomonas aquamarina]SIN60896.1 4-aminobutyrate aminotransferase / (S)-3-amino-2-methylpropionate transaminase [Halomonas meridiana]SIN68485.1 4-aminobutyrate aminotransferase / (S)-3-amino-2-methylprop